MGGRACALLLWAAYDRWLRPSADGIELFNIAKVPVTRCIYRDSKIPSAWATAKPRPNGRRRESPLPGDRYGGFG